MLSNVLCGKWIWTRKEMNQVLRHRFFAIMVIMASFLNFNCLMAAEDSADDPNLKDPNRLKFAKMLVEYYEQMTVPKPFVIRQGQDFKDHQKQLRKKLLGCMALDPLPERVPLDIHQSEPFDHPWCTVRRVYYQIWPEVYADGLLYMPKEFSEKPAPAMLCPHGHWNNGSAYTDVQKRCLVFAKMGYVVFSPTQNHYEDLAIGISNQSLMVWGNMRALDYLQSLGEVDKEKIGVAGASGGGLQTQMIVGLDDRVTAATIHGLTCEYREILYPYHTHCGCNHFPNVMRYTDWPEISALGLPSAVQYLVMNDWTRRFRYANFPTIQQLYTANGVAERTECHYETTGHIYDRSKRERTYWWMEKWVRGKEDARIESEPDEVKTFFPEKTLVELSAEVPNNKGFKEISSIYRKNRYFKIPAISEKSDWYEYTQNMIEDLKELLGEEAELPPKTIEIQKLSKKMSGMVVVEHINCPSESEIFIPTIILRRQDARGNLPVVFILDEKGADELLKEQGDDSAMQLAEEGSLVVLADIRFVGQFSLPRLSGYIGPTLMTFKPAAIKSMRLPPKDKKLWGYDRVGHLINAWERNSIVWGRPLSAMACTDIRAVLDNLSSRQNADMTNIKVVSRNCSDLAAAALFAAALDKRIASLDVDFADCCFENGKLPLVPFILQHGDILQWAALLADRQLTIRNVPSQAGDISWLSAVFATMQNSKGLIIDPQ